MKTIGNTNAKHAYLIECGNTRADYSEVAVFANNRAQAARIAEREGLVVRSVNMVG